MIVFSAQTAQSLGPHARNRPSVIFVQAQISAAGPIKIEGTADPAMRLREIDRELPVETLWIGMIPHDGHRNLAKAIGEQHEASRLRHDWFSPTPELIAYIQHVAQQPLIELLEQVRLSRPDGLLSIDDVAAQLGVSVSTVRRLVKDKHIPVIRVGNQLRFVLTDVLASLQRSQR